jgi:hypothetical protein
VVDMGDDRDIANRRVCCVFVGQCSVLTCRLAAGDEV